MNKEPAISVVVPVYNGETYLREAIDSVLSQNLTDFELILVNDGSTDKSEDIILSYKDPRIVYLKKEKNSGIIDTLNLGLEKSKGKYIVRMDADDVSLPGRFAKQFAFMEAHPVVGAAGTAYRSISEKGSKDFFVATDPEVLRTLLLFNSCLCHPSVIIRKDILTEHQIRYSDQYKHAEDYDLWVQISKVSQLTNLPEILLNYRHHEKQGTQVHNTVQKESAAAIRKKYLHELGFSCTEEQLKIHSIIGAGQLIDTKEILGEIENWLLHLVLENIEKNIIQPKHFNAVIGKMWFDSCGMTNLGLYAFNTFHRSGLSSLYHGGRLKLLAKCLLRSSKK